MNQNIAVIYQFELKDNASEQEFMALNAQLDTFLLQCDGFQYRAVSKNDKGQWFDMLFWENSECAFKTTGIEDLKAFQQLMGLMNHDSLIIQRTEIQSNVSPMANVA